MNHFSNPVCLHKIVTVTRLRIVILLKNTRHASNSNSTDRLDDWIRAVDQICSIVHQAFTGSEFSVKNQACPCGDILQTDVVHQIISLQYNGRGYTLNTRLLNYIYAVALFEGQVRGIGLLEIRDLPVFSNWIQYQPRLYQFEFNRAKNTSFHSFPVCIFSPTDLMNRGTWCQFEETHGGTTVASWCVTFTWCGINNKSTNDEATSLCCRLHISESWILTLSKYDLVSSSCPFLLKAKSHIRQACILLVCSGVVSSCRR